MMLEAVSGFDWDAGNTAKCMKHGLAVEDVESLFQTDIDLFPDIAHSSVETRFFGIGRLPTGRYVFVAFTLRTRDGQTFIRPISARFMHEKEIRHYAAEITRRKN
jgi:uncharacterized protein